MASGVSYVPARISDRHHNCRDLNQALHILGFGSWNELWPGKTIFVNTKIIFRRLISSRSSCLSHKVFVLIQNRIRKTQSGVCSNED